MIIGGSKNSKCPRMGGLGQGHLLYLRRLTREAGKGGRAKRKGF